MAGSAPWTEVWRAGWLNECQPREIARGPITPATTSTTTRAAAKTGRASRRGTDQLSERSITVPTAASPHTNIAAPRVRATSPAPCVPVARAICGESRITRITAAEPAAATPAWSRAVKRARLSATTSTTASAVPATPAREYVRYVAVTAAGTNASATARWIRFGAWALQARPIAVDIAPQAATAFQ